MKNKILMLFLALVFSVSAFAQKPGFELVFGERPSGSRDHDMKRAQMVYDAQKDRFDGLVEESFPVEALLLYEEIGLGNPVSWKHTDGRIFVAFPEARYFKVIYMPLTTARLFPGVTWRTWHLDSVSKGFCVPELSRSFPSSVIVQNTKNCVTEVEDGLNTPSAQYWFAAGMIERQSFSF